MDLLFWTYLANAVILINHEIDSAFWQEWKLISPKQKNGINSFLILHIPMLFVILLGLVFVYNHTTAGLVISLILASGGLFAFFFHFYHLHKGKPQFDTLVSKAMIIATFAVSIFQIVLTVMQLLK
jgi:uncharacterized membrane protein